MFNWAVSHQLGSLSEVTVLAPIRKGLVPGERWTYEEKIRARLDQVAKRARKGIPTDLSTVASIHLGRVTVIRPEHYLLYSDVKGVTYEADAGGKKIPAPIDAYARPVPGAEPPPALTSFLLVQVAFDGSIETYFRDIANFVGDFDSIFENCEEYPSARDFEKFWSWIRRYQMRPDLFVSPYPSLSPVRIKELEHFKRRFDAFVAQVRGPEGYRVESLEDAFDRFLFANGPIARGFPAPGGTYPQDEEVA